MMFLPATGFLTNYDVLKTAHLNMQIVINLSKYATCTNHTDTTEMKFLKKKSIISLKVTPNESFLIKKKM